MLNTDNPHHFIYQTPNLNIHVLGGVKTTRLDSLRVTLGVQKNNTDQIYRHNLDLYNDTQVEKLLRKVVEKLHIGMSDLNKTIQDLISLLENYRFKLLENQEDIKEEQVELTKKEQAEAMAFLRSENLLEKTNEKIEESGVVGEHTNRLLMYLIFTSRKTSNPLHVISLGSSGVGKTHLQSAISELIPREDKVEITILSANAFYYFNRTELRHKLILIEDLDGAESVLYPLRELQTKKKVTKTVVHKDQKGTAKTVHLVVEGPVSVAGCTTQESVYEDNSNRNFLLYVDESELQDRRVMVHQRKEASGKINSAKQDMVKRLMQNTQRLLKPIKVVNPYAESLKLPNSVYKPRRTNTHYLELINAITFYHQFQREQKRDKQTGEVYIETTLDDIRQANKLIQEVLLRKSDALSGGARNYLEKLKSYLSRANKSTFNAIEVRHILKVSKSTQQRYHAQLFDNQYIKSIKPKDNKLTSYKLINQDYYQSLSEKISASLAHCIESIQ